LDAWCSCDSAVRFLPAACLPASYRSTCCRSTTCSFCLPFSFCRAVLPAFWVPLAGGPFTCRLFLHRSRCVQRRGLPCRITRLARLCLLRRLPPYAHAPCRYIARVAARCLAALPCVPRALLPRLLARSPCVPHLTVVSRFLVYLARRITAFAPACPGAACSWIAAVRLAVSRRWVCRCARARARARAAARILPRALRRAFSLYNITPRLTPGLTPAFCRYRLPRAGFCRFGPRTPCLPRTPAFVLPCLPAPLPRALPLASAFCLRPTL